MLIRASQLRAFGEGARADFVAEMNAHLARFSPPLHATLGDARMAEVVRGGLARAEAHGLTRRGSLRLFLEMMLLFGSSFDRDPQVPWARAVLEDQGIANEMFRAGRLAHLTEEYLDRVHGPQNEHADAALARLGELGHDLVVREHSVRADVTAALTDTFPQKAAYLGREVIDAVLDEAEVEAARWFGPAEVRGCAILAIMMFSFGIGCAKDPLYPWIGATLAHKAGDGRRRAAALERKAMMWLEAVNARRRAARA